MPLRDGLRALLRALGPGALAPGALAPGALALAALALAALAACAPAGPPPGVRDDFVPGQVVVGFRPGMSAAERAALRTGARAVAVAALSPDSERWELPAGSDPLALVATLRARGVRYAQPNWIRRIGHARRAQAYSAGEFDPAVDARDNRLWHLALIRVDLAWSVDRPGSLRAFGSDNPPGKNVIVAVVDSGVDVRHPDLAPNIVKDASGSPVFFDEIKACGRSDTFVARPATYSYDWETAYATEASCRAARGNVTGCPGPDGNGHGTHVAGIIAAIGNNSPGLGCSEEPCNTVGVGPGVAILPVKTMNALGDGDDFCIAKGMRDAADAGARVVNLSVGGSEPGPALEEAIEYLTGKGALMVAASGNGSPQVNYPAAYPGAVAVGAVGHPRDSRFPEAFARGIPYSAPGRELDLVAPGGADSENCPETRCGVFSTVPTYPSNVTLVGKVAGTGYGRLTGTSMAAPQVAAVAALIWGREPDLSPAQVRQRLIATARAVPGRPEGFSEAFGFGLLDPQRALLQVSHDGL